MKESANRKPHLSQERWGFREAEAIIDFQKLLAQTKTEAHDTDTMQTSLRGYLPEQLLESGDLRGAKKTAIPPTRADVQRWSKKARAQLEAGREGFRDPTGEKVKVGMDLGRHSAVNFGHREI